MSRKREAEDTLEKDQAEKETNGGEEGETWKPATDEAISQRRILHVPRKDEEGDTNASASSSSPKLEFTFAKSVPPPSTPANTKSEPAKPLESPLLNSSSTSSTTTPVKFDFNFKFDFKTPTASPAFPSTGFTAPDFSALFSSPGFTSASPLVSTTSATASTSSTTSFDFGLPAGPSSLFGINIAAPKEPTEGKAAEPDKPAVPILNEPVDNKTGEEEETRALSLRAKLFVLDVSGDISRWRERGVGSVHLNVGKDGQNARLVMRTDTTLRLILNARVFPGMDLEKVQDKSVRITALEEGKLVPYLIRVPKKEDALALFEKISQYKGSSSNGGDTKQVAASETKETKETKEKAKGSETGAKEKSSDSSSLPPEEENI